MFVLPIFSVRRRFSSIARLFNGFGKLHAPFTRSLDKPAMCRVLNTFQHLNIIMVIDKNALTLRTPSPTFLLARPVNVVSVVRPGSLVLVIYLDGDRQRAVQLVQYQRELGEFSDISKLIGKFNFNWSQRV